MIYQRKRSRETLTAKNQEVSSLKQLRSLIHHKILPDPRWSFRQAQRSWVFPFRCVNSRTVAYFKLTPLISPSLITEPSTNAHDLPLNDGSWRLDTYYLKKIIVSLLKYAMLRNANRLKQNVSKQSIPQHHQPVRRRRPPPPANWARKQLAGNPLREGSWRHDRAGASSY